MSEVGIDSRFGDGIQDGVKGEPRMASAAVMGAAVRDAIKDAVGGGVDGSGKGRVEDGRRRMAVGTCGESRELKLDYHDGYNHAQHPSRHEWPAEMWRAGNFSVGGSRVQPVEWSKCLDRA